ncbi:MAG: hypothetical protein A2Y15_03580 [Clostridiales bacterium GWF2_36_10]|nr:MAG: hypothetical protein A2Y15_03580 [Clostridiales bacterium GWF2_36_10]HAN20294.1 hypothetical protein [Clostridiales bacterium]
MIKSAALKGITSNSGLKSFIVIIIIISTMNLFNLYNGIIAKDIVSVASALTDMAFNIIFAIVIQRYNNLKINNKGAAHGQL